MEFSDLKIELFSYHVKIKLNKNCNHPYSDFWDIASFSWSLIMSVKIWYDSLVTKYYFSVSYSGWWVLMLFKATINCNECFSNINIQKNIQKCQIPPVKCCLSCSATRRGPTPKTLSWLVVRTFQLTAPRFVFGISDFHARYWDESLYFLSINVENIYYF